jgi:type IV pilus assembly protein PilA
MKNVRGGGGFTLAELLIVMAIIVVLAAIAVPTFGKQLETARESNDAEAIRAVVTDAFTEAYMDFMNNGTMTSTQGYPKKTGDATADGATVKLTQTVAGFNYLTPTFTVGGGTISGNVATVPAIPTNGGAVGDTLVAVYFEAANGSIKLSDIKLTVPSGTAASIYSAG